MSAHIPPGAGTIGSAEMEVFRNMKPNAEGYKGHLPGTVGDAPAVLMVIQTAGEPTIGQPCHCN